MALNQVMLLTLNKISPKLGLIAGGGDLPFQVIMHCLKIGRPLFGIGIEGHTDPLLFSQNISHIWCRLGALGKMMEALRQAEVKDIVLIGSIKRPSFFEIRPDFYTAKLLARLGTRSLGDDALLSFLIQELESEGFSVKGIEDILPFQDVLLKAGPLGKIPFPEEFLEERERGINAARLLGQADVGQSLIIDQGLILGVEGIEGTDSLIKRCGILKKERFSFSKRSGFLVKFSKPQQEDRVDLPTLGPQTLEALDHAGFLGVVGEAHKTLLIHQKKCQKIADEKGLFVVGWEAKK